MLCARRPLIVIGIWFVMLVVIIGAVRVVGSVTSNDLSLPGTGSQEAKDLLQAKFPPQQNGANPIVFDIRQGKLTDQQYKKAIQDSVKEIKKQPHVFSVTNPLSNAGKTAGLLSKDKHTAFAPVLMDVSGSDLTTGIAQDVMDATEPAQKAGITTAAAGSIGSTLSTEASETSEIVGILVAMLILSLVLGSLVSMGMPILTAALGLGAALALVGLAGHAVAIPTSGPTLATMIGLGVGIDYALFLVTRHQEQLRDGMAMDDSIANAVATSGSAIVFAGGTVVIALLSLAVAGIPLVTALGLASAIAVVMAVFGAITLLPALLGLLAHRIHWARVPAFIAPRPKPGEGMWHRWAGVVRRHPIVVSVLTLAALGPLVIPVFSLELGQEDVGATNPETTERQAYDLITAGFGVGYNGPLQVASELNPPAAPSAAYTKKYDKATSLKKKLDKAQKQLPKQQKQLEQEQKQLQAQQASLEKQKSQLQAEQASLTAQGNQLKAQQASLEQQGAQLQQQKAALEKKGATLQRQKAHLEAEQRVLEREQAALKKRAEALAAEIRPLARRLALLKAREAALERRIKNNPDKPQLLQRLQRRLERVRAREAEVEKQLAPLEKRARKLAAEAQRLQQQAAVLQRQAARLQAQADQLNREKASLQAQAASLQSQGDALQAKADELQRQGDALQAQGAELQQQGDALQAQGAQLQAEANELKQEQKQAQQEQKQAVALQNQLTAMVTTAGGDDRGTDPRVVSLQQALLATNGVVSLTPPQINKKGDVVLLSAVPSTSPASDATASLVKQVRSDVLPPVDQGGMTSYVGGYTASYVDLAALISARLLLVIGTVILLGFLLLMIAFRSLLIPLQAAVTNLLSAAASFGVLTAVFQWGWGISQVGIDTPDTSVPIASYVPLMMFAVLFGLSMDYEVFLVSHVQMHHHRGEPAKQAVASGLGSSARITSAAALIMASVFASFILNGDPVIKQFGVGLATAVVLAGILVVTLAPAAIVLFGEAAWWLPGWLDKILPHISVEGETMPPAEEDAEPSGPPEPAEPSPA
ncbi:MAG TPA: MMPL family transporter [Nocardioides sp.]|nr:MMPL family transporter [Nocardioides sp.]